jgi:two-component system, NarL family, nitrate/nitrite response regulator NarL
MESESFGTVLIGHNVLFREGLRHILNAADFCVVASASDADVPILSSLPQDRPLLLIIETSSDFDRTLHQIDSFRERYPGARVAVFGQRHHPHQIRDMVSAFQRGANAFFLNMTTREVFIKSIELIMLGETILPAIVLTLLCERGDESFVKSEGPNGSRS